MGACWLISSVTSFSLPSSAANMADVFPSRARTFTEASFSMRNITASYWLLRQAWSRGVQPISSLASTSACVSTRNFKVSIAPEVQAEAASMSTFCPRSVRAFTSAPSQMASTVPRKSPARAAWISRSCSLRWSFSPPFSAPAAALTSNCRRLLHSMPPGFTGGGGAATSVVLPRLMSWKPLDRACSVPCRVARRSSIVVSPSADSADREMLPQRLHAAPQLAAPMATSQGGEFPEAQAGREPRRAPRCLPSA
mmetsp:Transcript_60307/g.155342  ORF Transcript_60307/g.155342 Transcript_60307/m.155342 type:complete len:253 (-) Transcript_60307:2-760(-)